MEVFFRHKEQNYMIYGGKKTDMEIITLNELQTRANPLHTQSRCFKDTWVLQ